MSAVVTDSGWIDISPGMAEALLIGASPPTEARVSEFAALMLAGRWVSRPAG